MNQDEIMVKILRMWHRGEISNEELKAKIEKWKRNELKPEDAGKRLDILPFMLILAGIGIIIWRG